MKYLSLILFTILWINSNAQINWTWVSSGGSGVNNYSKSIINATDFDSNNNTYVTGCISSPAKVDSLTLISYGNEDILIAKYNVKGELLWAKTAGSKSWDYGRSIQYRNGFLYILGVYRDTAYFDNQIVLPVNYGISFFIAKMDTNGNFIWIKNGCTRVQVGFPDFPIMTLTTDNRENIYFSGFCNNYANLIDTTYNSNNPFYPSAFFITQLDSGGNMNWVYFKKAMPHSNTGIDIKIDDYDLIYSSSVGRWDTVLNGPNSSTSYANLLIGKISNKGNVIWEKEIGDTSNYKWSGFPQEISLGANNQIYMSGIYHKSFELSQSVSGFGGGFTAKFNSINGNLMSAKTFSPVNSSSTVYFRGCEYKNDNVIYSGMFCGTVNFGGITLSPISQVYDCDNFIVSYDTNGILNWATRYGYFDDDYIAASSSNNNMYAIYGNFVDSLTLGTYTMVADTNNSTSRSFYIGTQFYQDTSTTNINTIYIPDAGLNFKIYPNPTASKIIVETQKNLDEYIIEVFSLDGKLISKQNDFESKSIDVSHLKPGVYYISLRNKKTQVVKKFIKI